MSTPCEGSRDIGEGIIVSITPDVCKTPVGSSMVPVPYSITAKQADDANTVATVRFTKKRAHNMASLVTKCTGDAPGTGTGIKSGTVGSVCHPKSHSNNVRIKGEWAIRDGDTWYMNNKNTVGKLVYVKSKQTFEETPAILLTQKPDSLLPEGAENSDMVNAILAGIASAQTKGLPAGSYLVAQAGPLTVAPAPAAPAPTVPNSAPNTTNVGPQGPAANDNNARPKNNRIARTPAAGRMAAAGRVLGLLGLAQAGYQMGDMAGQWYVGPDGVLGRRIGEVVGQGQVSVWSPQGQAIGRALGFPSFGADAHINYANNLLSLKAGQPIDFRTLPPDELEKIIQAPWPDAETIDANAKALPAQRRAQEEATRAESQVTPGNVRVEEDEEDPKGCLVGEYQDIKDKCAGEAHHIVPDMAYRLGARPTGAAMSSNANRTPNSPTLNKGMAICLTPSQHGSGSTGIHGRLRGNLNTLGAASPVAGTAPMGQILAASIAEILAIPDLPAECKALASARATEQVKNTTGMSAPGRTKERPLPSGDALRVLSAGAYN